MSHAPFLIKYLVQYKHIVNFQKIEAYFIEKYKGNDCEYILIATQCFTQNCYIEINSTRYTCLYFITKTENACIYCEIVLHDNHNRVSALNVFISVKRSVVSDENNGIFKRNKYHVAFFEEGYM